MQKALTLNLTTGIIQNSSVPFITVDDRPVFLDIVNSGSVYVTGGFHASGHISASGNITASGNIFAGTSTYRDSHSIVTLRKDQAAYTVIELDNIHPSGGVGLHYYASGIAGSGLYASTIYDSTYSTLWIATHGLISDIAFSTAVSGYVVSGFLASGFRTYERVRITHSGNLLVGKTTTALTGSGNVDIQNILNVDGYIKPFGVRASRNTSLAQSIYAPWFDEESNAFALIYAGSSNTSNGQVSIYGESYSAVGVVGYAPGGTGVQGTSAAGIGVNAVSTGVGYGLFAQSQNATSGLPIYAERLGNTTNAPQTVALFEYWKNTGGTAAAGIGARIQFAATTTDGGTPPEVGDLDFIWGDATHASRTGALSIKLVNNAAAAAEVARFGGNGNFYITGRAAVGVAGTLSTASIHARGTMGIQITEASSLGGVRLQNPLYTSTSFARIWVGHNAYWDESDTLWHVDTVGANDTAGILIENGGEMEFIIHTSTGSSSRTFTHANFIAGSRMTLTSAGNLATDGTITGVGAVTSTGANAGLVFNDRSGSNAWQWYGQSDVARLYNGTRDIMQWTDAGVVSLIPEDSGTNNVVSVFTLQRTSTGTVAAGFGEQITINLEASAGSVRSAAAIQGVWTTATDTARAGEWRLFGYDGNGATTTAREFLRGGSTGSAAGIGFFATGIAAKQTVTGSRGGNAALASLLTALATYGLITNSSSA